MRLLTDRIKRRDGLGGDRVVHLLDALAIAVGEHRVVISCFDHEVRGAGCPHPDPVTEIPQVQPG